MTTEKDPKDIHDTDEPQKPVDPQPSDPAPGDNDPGSTEGPGK